MGPESVRRGRLTSSCPGPTERQGAEPLPRTLLQSQRRPAADAVVATKHSDRRRASRRRRGGDEDGKWLAKSDVPKLFINGHPGRSCRVGFAISSAAGRTRPNHRSQGHFIQEDSPDEIAAAVAQFVRALKRWPKPSGPSLENQVERSLRSTSEPREAAIVHHHLRQPLFTRLRAECRSLLRE